ncbi:MAG: 50S ribosomal protein L21 [Nitrospinota bacterium]|nr:50S ribosomal protein L21 [Nitrospinota bacterium]
MFAIVAAGGKQFKVAEGDIIDLQRMDGEVGAQVDLGPVLMSGAGSEVKIGAPVVEDTKVTATILAQDKGPKVITFKGRKRKDSRTKKGSRQMITTVKIVSIK